MKLLIDVEKDYYEMLKYNVEHGTKYKPFEIIANGIPYEDEAAEWIPISERTPDDLEPVNITWINHEPEPYYKEIKDKPFTATGIYFNGQWYWWSTFCADIIAEYGCSYNDIIDKAIEITHWRPLPEPCKENEK